VSHDSVVDSESAVCWKDVPNGKMTQDQGSKSLQNFAEAKAVVKLISRTRSRPSAHRAMARLLFVALVLASAHGFVIPTASAVTTSATAYQAERPHPIAMATANNKTPRQGTRGSADVVELLGDISGELFKGNSGALFIVWALIVANLLGVFN